MDRDDDYEPDGYEMMEQHAIINLKQAVKDLCDIGIPDSILDEWVKEAVAEHKAARERRLSDPNYQPAF